MQTMPTKRVLWGAIVLALVTGVLWVGFALFQRNHQLPANTEITVNGEPIVAAGLDEAFINLLLSYRRVYMQSGGDFEELLDGPSGAYYQLQIRYQAAQQLIDQALIRQEAQRRGLVPIRQDLLEQAFQERYQKFLERNGLTETDLQALFQDPQKKRLTQRLLGLRDESVEALKARMRRESEYILIKIRLAEALLGPKIAPDSQEGGERLNQWLSERKADSKIVYVNPLLNAYHLEKRIEQGKTLEERLRYLDAAIAAYEEIQNEGLSSDPYISYYLAQLYNWRVNWTMEREKELQAQKGQEEKLAELQGEIARHREKATQFFLSASDESLENEQQLQALLMADAGNPFYYYLYARFLLTHEIDMAIVRALRLLKRAIELDPEYADAYVLMGDLNVQREHFTEAIYYYSQALSLAETLQNSDGEFKARESRPPVVQRKLAEAYIARAWQLERFPQLEENSAQKRTEAISEADQLLRALLRQISPEDPDYPTLLADLGDVEFLRGNYGLAQARYRESLSYRSDNEVQVKLGRAQLQAGQLQEAQQAFENVLQNDPQWAPAYLGLAEIYRAQGALKQALQEYKRAFQNSEMLSYVERRQIALDALKIDPNDAEMRLMLADFYLSQHVYEGALEQYQAVLELAPNAHKAHSGLGKVFLARYDYPQAVSHFQMALKQNPPMEERIDLYHHILKAEQGAAGPGRPVGETGRNALYQLAVLFLQSGNREQSLQALRELRARYPQYRPDEVAKLSEQLTHLVGDDLPGRPVEDQGRRIIAPGEAHPPYNSNPPTSGWHYAIPAEWGIHDAPILDEVQVRNLAGGGVLIQYQPDLLEQTLAKLRAFVAELRQHEKYCRVILAPYPALSHPIVLTAWNRMDELSDFDPERLRRFIDAFIDRGPEVGEVSCSS